jgi:hypothetical protein
METSAAPDYIITKLHRKQTSAMYAGVQAARLTCIPGMIE